MAEIKICVWANASYFLINAAVSITAIWVLYKKNLI